MSSASVPRSYSSSLPIIRREEILLIPEFHFAGCLSHTVTMTTKGGDVGCGLGCVLYKQTGVFLQRFIYTAATTKTQANPSEAIEEIHQLQWTWSYKLYQMYYLFNFTLWLSPASNRIFQSLLLKFVLMRFQKMSAPWDRERAWRSCGTAREASWQNSDFNMDHRLKHKHQHEAQHTKQLQSDRSINMTPLNVSCRREVGATHLGMSIFSWTWARNWGWSLRARYKHSPWRHKILRQFSMLNKMSGSSNLDIS